MLVVYTKQRERGETRRSGVKIPKIDQTFVQLECVHYLRNKKGGIKNFNAYEILKEAATMCTVRNNRCNDQPAGRHLKKFIIGKCFYTTFFNRDFGYKQNPFSKNVIRREQKEMNQFSHYSSLVSCYAYSVFDKVFVI